MTYKNFEIRPLENKNRYELVKWYTNVSPYCITIAFIEWNPKEYDWKFESVGTRFLFEYEEGLNNFILKYLELLSYVRGDVSAN